MGVKIKQNKYSSFNKHLGLTKVKGWIVQNDFYIAETLAKGTCS